MRHLVAKSCIKLNPVFFYYSWVQYTPNMNQTDLEAYWKNPFTVKPELGFYAWKKKTKLRLVDDRVLSEPEFLGDAYMNFFSDKLKLEKFIELNTIEVKKGEDLCYFATLDQPIYLLLLPFDLHKIGGNLL